MISLRLADGCISDCKWPIITRRSVPRDSQLSVLRDAGVLLQPDALELREVPEPADLAQVGELVLADVQLLEVAAVLDVGQRRDAVDAERETEMKVP